MKNLRRCAALIAAAAIFAFVFASCNHGSGANGDPQKTTYTVTVTNGTATPATAAAGTNVAIKANAPAEGKVFDKWTTTTEGVVFGSETLAETTFEMPARNVVIAATYKDVEAVSLATPLTLEAIEAGTITVSNAWPTLKYTLNGGELTAYSEAINAAAGDKICFYAESSGNSGSDDDDMNITCSAGCYVYGNIMSLVTLGTEATSASQWDPEATALTTAYAFNRLFGYSTLNNNIKSLASKKLYLPATTLTNHCYRLMFANCAALMTAPELPATTLADRCYEFMFLNCAALTTAPELPAATLTEGCYHGMFANCESLNYIKCLATDVSAEDCTVSWVSGVAETGIFVRVSGANWSNDEFGIPSGWTVPERETPWVAAKLPTEDRPDSIAITGSFGDVVMELLDTGWHLAYNADDFKAYEYDAFTFCDSSNNSKVLCKANGTVWEPAVFVFGELWVDSTYKGDPVKEIDELDLSDADTYAWRVMN